MLQAHNFLSLKLYILPPRTAASICLPPSYDLENMKLQLISLRLKETKGKNQKSTRFVAPCSRGNFSGKRIRRVDGTSGDTTCRTIRVIFRRSSKWRLLFGFSVSDCGLNSLFRPTVTYLAHQNIRDLIRHNSRRRGLPTPIPDAHTRFMWGNLQERTTWKT
jgi:hypothetical protein